MEIFKTTNQKPSLGGASFAPLFSFPTTFEKFCNFLVENGILYQIIDSSSHYARDTDAGDAFSSSEMMRGVASIQEANFGSISFIDSLKHQQIFFRRYKNLLRNLSDREGVEVPPIFIIIKEGLTIEKKHNVVYISVTDPKKVIATVVKTLEHIPSWEGVSKLSTVHESVVIHPTSHIGPYCYIERDVWIDENTRIFPFCYIGKGSRIGKHCTIYPRVTIMDRVIVGSGVKIFPGAVIGSDGFGFFEHIENHPQEEGAIPSSASEKPQNLSSQRHPMPQVGIVHIGDHVRIGANTTIDRATFSETRIEDNVLIDNLVQVGHNVKIGKRSILCAQAGIGGSSVLEQNVILGGQAGVSDGVHLDEGVRMGAQCGTSVNLKKDTSYFLTPAVPLEQSLQMIKATRKLHKFEQDIKKIKDKLGLLSSKEEST